MTNRCRSPGGDGTQVLADGFDDPQAMRMILLQVLTGRRSSEIRTCEFDCLSPAGGHVGNDVELTRFQYAQSKIDIAPDSILVDHEVTAVIEEQQTWLRGRFPGVEPHFLFTQRTGNRRQALPVRDLHLGAARVQQRRGDHRQQGPTVTTQP